MAARDVLSPDGAAPSVALFQEVWPGILAAGGETMRYQEKDVHWIIEEVIPALCGGGWAHLLPTAMTVDPYLFELDRSTSEAHAAWFGLPDLMALMAPSMILPSLHAFDDHPDLKAVLGNWFSPSHPIARITQIVDDRSVRQADPDATLKVVLEEMKVRGALGEAFCARTNDKFSGSVAHMCAGRNLTQSMLFLIANGLDLEVRDAMDCSLEDSASNHPQMIQVIRSSRLRTVAMEVVCEINGNTRSMEQQVVRQ